MDFLCCSDCACVSVMGRNVTSNPVCECVFFSLKCPAGEDFLLVKALQVVCDAQYEI